MNESLFREAVAAVDAGDEAALARLLAAHPDLARQRLAEPGSWLRDLVGEALDGYFRAPYLLWFVAENPIRTGRLPPTVLEVAGVLVEAAGREGEQLDAALELVATGAVARDSGRQLALLDLFIDAGAAVGDGVGAIAHGNLEAAAHLLVRGGRLTLAAAMVLDRDADAARLLEAAGERERQVALTAAALHGKAAALARLIARGVDVSAFSVGIHPHATPLHQAVWSGSLAAVQALVAAGAGLAARDRVHGGTPLGWAEYAERRCPAERRAEYAAIAAYLRAL